MALKGHAAFLVPGGRDEGPDKGEAAVVDEKKGGFFFLGRTNTVNRGAETRLVQPGENCFPRYGENSLLQGAPRRTTMPEKVAESGIAGQQRPICSLAHPATDVVGKDLHSIQKPGGQRIH